MAISKTDAVVNQQKRSEFGTTMSANNYKTAVGFGYGNVTYHGNPNISSNRYDPLEGKVAGIRVGFVTSFNNAIEEYEKGLNAIIDKLETDVNVDVAFAGTAVPDALLKLITAVKAEAKSYLNTMKEAEVQIIQSIIDAYQKQDEAVGGSMNQDTSKLNSGASTGSTAS